MTESWKLLEPIFLTATLTLVGWMSLEVVTHKSDIALARESLARALDHIELELPIKSMEVLEELERIEKSN